ncbi:MAG TPA: von Willebrand factor type A domain-containing protein [Xanthomonadales bacterium]|nr:von Willebrand factor type A domain-containing protein [Xanthomonadales bacterium]
MITIRPLPLVLAIAGALALGACARNSAPPADARQNQNERAELAAKGDEGRVSRDAPAEPKREAQSPLAIAPMSQPAVAPAPMVADAVSAQKAVATGMIAPASPSTGPQNRAGIDKETDTERYADLAPNPIIAAAQTPVSTFSIDVDTGAYSNVRRFLDQGQLPPTDAVRIEEFINYFDYQYPTPDSLAQPFTVSTELAKAPWNADRWLLQVGLKGFEVPLSQLPASNLVFLLDVSGSMMEPNKLPLVKTALGMVVEQMRPQDTIAIVVYAGAAGLVLPATKGSDKASILAALDALEAGGSTNGGEGIQLAYQVAREQFVDGGVNRVILATDGDFNVGLVDQQDLEDLVTRERKSGIALTTLGFGQGNYNDEIAERLADLGNGNHAYIDSEREARKVLVKELSSNLLTIAKDVKIQIEFNPALVAEYRLIGYENRMLAREDFNNDAVDAGEIGAGHTVTALYELTPVGSKATRLPPLRYATDAKAKAAGNEIAFLKLRYKQPDADKSELIEQVVVRPREIDAGSSQLQFAASVAAFGEALRGGKYLDGYDYAAIAALAQANLGPNPYGMNAEFVELVGKAAALSGGDEGQIAIAR